MSDHRHSHRSGGKRARRATTASPAHSAASEATPAVPVIFSLADIRTHGAHSRPRQPHAIAYAVGATVVVLVGVVIALFTTSGTRAAAVKDPKLVAHTPASSAPPPVTSCPLTGTPA
ncbi:MAG: hypothetical protein ACRDWB_07875, partial [Acidimicrobiales bacterium]